MATTTPNYGWTVPTSTDLVKDGATAIETLGDAIDASMNTALGTKKAGMVLLNTTSFSAVASQSFNNVFTSTYDNYLIQYNMTKNGTDADSQLTFRLRVSGTDNSNSSYTQVQEGMASGGFRTSVNTTLTSFNLQNMYYTASRMFGSITLMNPQRNDRNTLITNHANGGNASYNLVTIMSGLFSANTSFDGFTLSLTNMNDATVSIYGYNK
jgi:hypothetical protein